MFKLRLAGGRIQDQREAQRRMRRIVEVQHRVDRVGDRVERALSEPGATEPVVLDEADHRGLVGQRVIYEVDSRERRDYQQRQARPEGAAALRMRERGG